MAAPIEIVFYIHGVTPVDEVQLHTADYNALHNGIRAAGVDPMWPSLAECGGAEWGWNYDGGEAKSHKALAAAQRVYGSRLLPIVREQNDFSWRFLERRVVDSLRKTVFYGFGDMFYYVSREGKWAVRLEVAKQILEHIDRRRGDSGRPLSLTLLGHSAGAVVAFDFLYYLFSQRKTGYLNSAGETKKTRSDARRCRERLHELSELASSQQLRLRRLVTFGSPVGFLTFRSDAVVEILARNGRLRPADYGLDSRLQEDEPLAGPRWINIWDKDDPIAWPVAPLMDSPLVDDVYVDVSDAVADVHTAYWESKRVHEAIAQRW